jgi:hypothetical protein
LQAGRYTAAGRQLIDALAQDPHQLLIQRNLTRSVNAWLLRRADFAALAWLCGMATVLIHNTVVERIVGSGLAALLVIGGVLSYRRLPATMRRLVRARPSRADPRRFVAWLCIIVLFIALALRSAAVTPALQQLAIAFSGLSVAAVFVTAFRAYARTANAADRLQRRWRHRVFLRQASRLAKAS